MFKKLFKLFLPIFILFLVPLFSKSTAFAAIYTISGTVKTVSGTAVANASVHFYYPGTTSDKGTPTVTDSTGSYHQSLGEGTYDIQVTAPANTGYSPATTPNFTVSQDSTLNFILVEVGYVSFTGHIYDALGNPLGNQLVQIYDGSGTNLSSPTDSSGFYAIQAVPGKYFVEIDGEKNSFSVSAPEFYTLSQDIYNAAPLSLTQNTNFDFTLPAKIVTVHAQDESQNPLSNVLIEASSNGPVNTNVVLNGLTFTAKSSYGNNYLIPQTDSSGNAFLWLFPGGPYTFTATPPQGSIYSTTLLNDVNFSDNTEEIITLKTTVKLSGTVYDPLGNPVSNQTIQLNDSSGAGALAKTDSTGQYVINVKPGDYLLSISGENNPLSGNLPQFYNITRGSLSLSQDTNLDLTIPAKKVSVLIEDSLGNPVPGASVWGGSGPGGNGWTNYNLSVGNITGFTSNSFYGYNTNYPSPVTDSSGGTNLWLLPGDSYTLTAYPPVGSGYSTTVKDNLSVTGDTQELITLQKPVILSGHILDSLGNPLPNQTVQINDVQGTTFSSVTDSSGYYSLQASAGNYYLGISGEKNPFTLNVPQFYTLSNGNISLNQDTSMDFSIPSKQITIQVHNNLSQPVPNVSMEVSTNVAGSVTLNGITFMTKSSYGNNYTLPVTDSSGSAILNLLPGNYSLTATPPNGSIFQQYTTSIDVVGDATFSFSMLYNHPAPVTDISFNPGLSAFGSYQDPTTITLTATTVSPYTIQTTYYNLDNQGVKVYTGPFQVTGIQYHNIYYWSVDNMGVAEEVQHQQFTISANQDDHTPVLGAITVDPSSIPVGVSVSATANFSDQDTGDTHNGVWKWGDGTESYASIDEQGGIASGSHIYTKAGVYTVSLSICDNHSQCSPSQQYQYVVVFETSSGFITTSGRYTSKAGWDMQNLNASGEVKFGLQAKYIQNNSTPTGNAKFMFKTANLDFTISSFQWLVVNDNRAYVLANGVLNGYSNYTMFMAVIDQSSQGLPDLIRIRITDPNQDIVYDTQPGTGLTADPVTQIDTGTILLH